MPDSALPANNVVRRDRCEKGASRTAHESQTIFTCAGVPLNVVVDFRYLGRYIDRKLTCHKDVRVKVGKARAVVHRLAHFLRCPSISLKAKIRLVEQQVIPVAIYASETWRTSIDDRRLLAGAQMYALRFATGLKPKVTCTAPTEAIIASRIAALGDEATWGDLAAPVKTYRYPKNKIVMSRSRATPIGKRMLARQAAFARNVLHFRSDILPEHAVAKVKLTATNKNACAHARTLYDVLREAAEPEEVAEETPQELRFYGTRGFAT